MNTGSGGIVEKGEEGSMVKDAIPCKTRRALMHPKSMAKTPTQDIPRLAMFQFPSSDTEDVAICLSYVSGDIYVWLNKLGAQCVGI